MFCCSGRNQTNTWYTSHLVDQFSLKHHTPIPSQQDTTTSPGTRCLLVIGFPINYKYQSLNLRQCMEMNTDMYLRSLTELICKSNWAQRSRSGALTGRGGGMWGEWSLARLLNSINNRIKGSALSVSLEKFTPRAMMDVVWNKGRDAAWLDQHVMATLRRGTKKRTSLPHMCHTKKQKHWCYCQYLRKIPLSTHFL